MGIKEAELPAVDAGMIPTQFVTGVRAPKFDGEIWTVEIFEERGGEAVVIARFVLTPSKFTEFATTIAAPVLGSLWRPGSRSTLNA